MQKQRKNGMGECKSVENYEKEIQAISENRRRLRLTEIYKGQGMNH